MRCRPSCPTRGSIDTTRGMRKLLFIVLTAGALSSLSGCDAARTTPGAAALAPPNPHAAQPVATREGAAELRRISGRLIAVQDGDSFVLRAADGNRLHVRIEGIDAPERGQPDAEVSRQHLAALLRDAPLELRVRKRDRYDRLIAQVFVGDRDIGQAQLDAGLAWFFRRYAHEQPPALSATYARAEERARNQRKGLWRARAPQPPWEHRSR